MPKPVSEVRIVKGQIWKSKNGTIVKIRSVGDGEDGIVIYPDPNDEEASCWTFKRDLIDLCTLVKDVK